MAVPEYYQIGCAIQEYFDLLGAMGHLHPDEGKNLLLAVILLDYNVFAQDHEELFNEKEIRCLRNMLNKALRNSCILSKMILC